MAAEPVLSEVYALTDVAASPYYKDSGRVPRPETEVMVRWCDRAEVTVERVIVGYLPVDSAPVARGAELRGVVSESSAGNDPVVTVRLFFMR